MYGTIKVGTATNEPKLLKIVEYVQAQFDGGRIISVNEIEDGSFAISVENPNNSDRSSQSIWLHRESLVGVISTVMLMFNLKDLDLLALIEEASGGKDIDYNFSKKLQNNAIRKHKSKIKKR